MTRTVVVLAAFLPWANALAAVRLNSLFSDGTVFQRDQPIPVWGMAGDGERVTVRLLQQIASSIASMGKWRADLPPMKAGGPYDLVVEGADNKLTVHHVLIGEVWICGGQSNMELTVAQCDRADEEIAASRNPMFRLLRVPKLPADQAVSGHFGGVGYFFGRCRRGLASPSA